MEKTNSVNTAAPKNDAPDIQEAMNQVLSTGSNKELALIADMPDGTADILLIRGDAGTPECYWFTVNGGIMSPLLKGLVGKSLNMKDSDYAADAKLYNYMATVTGIAACFQTDIPGVELKEAFFSPLDYPICKFVSACGGFSTFETPFIKRNRNLAYKYRKACEALAKNDRNTADDTEDILGFGDTDSLL